jgi:hypothetical protein
MADTSERADIQEQVQCVDMSSGRHSPTWRTLVRGQTYRSRYSSHEFRRTQSNMADTSERADRQEQVQYRQTQSNMADTSERAGIQEQVQGVDISSGRHIPPVRLEKILHTSRLTVDITCIIVLVLYFNHLVQNRPAILYII